MKHTLSKMKGGYFMLLIKKMVPLSIFHEPRINSTRFVGIGTLELLSKWKDQKTLINAMQSLEDIDYSIQIFDGEKIISPNHLYYAVYFAEQAFALNSNISKTKSVEFLIYASMQRQIKTAITSVGFRIEESNHSSNAWIVILGPSETGVKEKFKVIQNVLNTTTFDKKNQPLSSSRLKFLQNHYNISDFELKNAIICMGIPYRKKFVELEEDIKVSAISQIITEKMAQLLMENFKRSN